MYDFLYHRPSSLDDVSKILAANPEAKIVAGGMTLLPTMKLRLAQPSDLVDISAVPELNGISENGDAIQIGAMTCHADVAGNELVRTSIPALAELADSIGDAQVRNRGTIGGSIANSDPAADYPAAILGLDATVVTSEREIRADDYFKGMFETALDENEVVLAVRFPRPRRAAYQKFPNPASRYAVVGVMVAETGGGVRVAVTGAGACAYRANDFETALIGNFTADAIADIEVDSSDFNSDLHASAAYRGHLVSVMARRAVQQISD